MIGETRNNNSSDHLKASLFTYYYKQLLKGLKFCFNIWDAKGKRRIEN